uniref:Large surface protein PORY_B22.3 n=1 Tax=Pneumocystis oryctolagi TaxID=42067 RepID=A0A7S5W3K5_9ASCO|nr:large surface protein PORY_B22.3 [Pneumocystis oryctolagi]
MKTFVFSVLIGIAHVFSRSVHVSERDEIRNISEHETPAHLFSKRSDYFLSSRPLENFPLGELIVAGLPNGMDPCINAMADLCTSLETSQQNIQVDDLLLSSICSTPSTIHAACHDLVDSTGQTGLDFVKGECGKIHKALKKLVNINLKDYVGEKYKLLKEDQCTRYTTLCDLFAPKCPFIRELCLLFSTMCYKKHHDDFTDMIIITQLKERLNSIQECNSTLSERCKCLVHLGVGLTGSCVKIGQTCDRIVHGLQTTCSSLKKRLQELVVVSESSSNSDDLEDSDDSSDSEDLKRLKRRDSSYRQRLSERECSLLNTLCHMFLSKCNDLTVQSLCKKQEEICTAKSTTASRTFQSFCGDEVTLMDLGFPYFDASYHGVMAIIRYPPFDSLIAFLLSIFHQSGNTLDQQCNSLFHSKCSSFGHSLFVSIEEDCILGKSDKCKGLDGRIKDKCKKLEESLLKLEFLSVDNWPPYLEIANSGNSYISRHKCDKLLSECYYLQNGCGENVKKLCSSLSVLCSWNFRRISLLTQFWEGLRTLSLKNSDGVILRDFSRDSKNVEDLYDLILETCKGLSGISPYIFMLCMRPMYIFSWLGFINTRSSNTLNEGLRNVVVCAVYLGLQVD